MPGIFATSSEITKCHKLIEVIKKLEKYNCKVTWALRGTSDYHITVEVPKKWFSCIENENALGFKEFGWFETVSSFEKAVNKFLEKVHQKWIAEQITEKED